MNSRAQSPIQSQHKLGLPVEKLHAIKMSYSTCKVVTFKLKNQINIDEMLDREEFKLERNEKCVFEITMHNDIAFKVLNKIVFHHLDKTQLNFNNVKFFYN